MTALDHYLEGERLLTDAKTAPLQHDTHPTVALKLAAARAHFDAARTLLAALNSLDMPDDDYKAWEQVALASPQPTRGLREFELDDPPAAEETAAMGRP